MSRAERIDSPKAQGRRSALFCVTLCSAVFLCASVSCFRRERSHPSPLSQSELLAVSSARTADELFERTCDVQLETDADCPIAEISDMDIDATGNFIISDGWQLGRVYLFASDGRYIRTLGRRGQGPGEYSTPVSVATSSIGEILICDYLRNQIVVYNADSSYLRSIAVKPRIQYFIHLDRRNEIFLYSGAVGPRQREVFDTIHRLDENGSEVLSFAPIPEDVLDLGFSAIADGMAIGEGDHFYEMNPLYYQIRKYTTDGKLIRSFTNPNMEKRLRKGGPEGILNGPFYLERGLIIVQRDGLLDVFDTEGNLIVDKIPLAPKILKARGNALYLEEWNMSGPERAQLNPKIICCQLRDPAG